MANAAALVLGLMLVWLAWAPQAIDPFWMAVGGVAVLAAFALTASLGGLDVESAPYLKAPRALVRGLKDGGRIAGAWMSVARRAVAGDPRLQPALMRLRMRSTSEGAPLGFANAVSRAPGAAVIDVEEDALLVHVLAEEDVKDDALSALEPVR